MSSGGSYKTNPDSNPNSNSNGISGFCNSVYGNPAAEANGNADTEANGNANTEANGNANAKTNGNTNTQTNGDTDDNANAGADSGYYRKTGKNAGTDKNSYRDGSTETSLGGESRQGVCCEENPLPGHKSKWQKRKRNRQRGERYGKETGDSKEGCLQRNPI